MVKKLSKGPERSSTQYLEDMIRGIQGPQCITGYRGEQTLPEGGWPVFGTSNNFTLTTTPAVNTVSNYYSAKSLL